MATRYAVLRLGDDNLWQELTTVEAHSADQAIRLIIDPAGKYVAIPVTKWHYRGPNGDDDVDRIATRFSAP
jgi:hypothetical protein